MIHIYMLLKIGIILFRMPHQYISHSLFHSCYACLAIQYQNYQNHHWSSQWRGPLHYTHLLFSKFLSSNFLHFINLEYLWNFFKIFFWSGDFHYNYLLFTFRYLFVIVVFYRHTPSKVRWSFSLNLENAKLNRQQHFEAVWTLQISRYSSMTL